MTVERDVISSVKHPAVVAARQSLRQVGKAKATAFLADGTGLVLQALAARAPVETIFLLEAMEPDRAAEIGEHARRAGAPCHLVSRGVFFKVLGLGYETAVQALAVVTRPGSRSPAEFLSADACLLVGEHIQDPRNVGVLVRTADAWALSCTIFSEDSADAFSRGSVRSSTGSIFRVPVVTAARLMDCLDSLKTRSVRIIGASAQAEHACWDADLAGPCAVLLGNESTGLSPEAKACCDELIAIPMTGGAHSFNVTVAAGIILYERERQMNDKRKGVEL